MPCLLNCKIGWPVATLLECGRVALLGSAKALSAILPPRLSRSLSLISRRLCARCHPATHLAPSAFLYIGYMPWLWHLDVEHDHICRRIRQRPTKSLHYKQGEAKYVSQQVWIFSGQNRYIARKHGNIQNNDCWVRHLLILLQTKMGVKQWQVIDSILATTHEWRTVIGGYRCNFGATDAKLNLYPTQRQSIKVALVRWNAQT